MPDSAALVIRGLTKSYPGPPPVDALRGIDLEVRPGEIFALLGPNGAGKTTTVGVSTTRVSPTSGTVRVQGFDVARDPAAVKRRIGVVTQYNTLDRACTVRENLYYHCRYFGFSGAEARRRADELLVQFRLADRAEGMTVTLSGGLAQRVQVARAIAHRPGMLFLDEPTAGLDPQSRLALWELVGALRAEGITVLLTTHYMEEADRLSDRVAIIDHGKVLVTGTPAELKRGIGAETVMEIHVAKAGEELRAVLAGLPSVRDVQVLPTGVRVLAQSREGLLPRLVEAALPFGLRDVAVHEPTLETVFIQLTGRELRD
ncbi:MAG TPA: ATP-binding cassette domain-containing protein [Gemmatimonadales bacterium]|nr:ATP-binding cassette domain-containing protein [Gemmatimonadales bacterium]